MLLPRAILILTCLAATAPAAPAPFPRDRKPADPHPWGQPVDGLRVRLLPAKACVRVGEPVVFTLEIQNVSGSTLAVEEPDLPHTFSAPGGRSRGWAVTCQRTGRDGLLRERQRDSIERQRKLRGGVPLAAGETLRVEITAPGWSREERLEERQKELDREGEPLRHEMRFRDDVTPGVYELRATFSRDSRRREARQKGGWAGDSLTSPPVRIELAR